MMSTIVRAEGYRLLGLCFGYPEPAELQSELRAAAEVDGLDSLAALADSVDGAISGEFTRLFATRVPVPPYETSYTRADKGARIGQIAMFYETFGAALGSTGADDARATERENPDYVGTELEFAAWLGLKLALAEDAGDADAARLMLDARQIWVREHLAAWVPTFAERLEAAAEHRFYQRLANAAGAWLAADLAEHGWEAPQPEPAPTGEEPECLTCPMHREA